MGLSNVYGSAAATPLRRWKWTPTPFSPCCGWPIVTASVRWRYSDDFAVPAAFNVLPSSQETSAYDAIHNVVSGAPEYSMQAAAFRDAIQGRDVGPVTPRTSATGSRIWPLSKRSKARRSGANGYMSSRCRSRQRSVGEELRPLWSSASRRGQCPGHFRPYGRRRCAAIIKVCRDP